jgi:uncharacterized membrane protein YdbT with pleckstrin-like domain
MRGFKKSLSKIIWKPKISEAEPSFVPPSFLILPEEKIIFKTNPHWLFVVAPEVVLVVLGILILKYLSYFLIEQIRIQRLILVLFGAVWGIVMIIIFLDWICTKYYLTNLRLIEERGIIGKRIMSIWLNKVQDVTCKFGILGRIFGFGYIEIESAGTYGKIVFDRIPSPRKFQKEIEKASLDLRFRYSSKGL